MVNPSANKLLFNILIFEFRVFRLAAQISNNDTSRNDPYFIESHHCEFI